MVTGRRLPAGLTLGRHRDGSRFTGSESLPAWAGSLRLASGLNQCRHSAPAAGSKSGSAGPQGPGPSHWQLPVSPAAGLAQARRVGVRVRLRPG